MRKKLFLIPGLLLVLIVCILVKYLWFSSNQNEALYWQDISRDQSPLVLFDQNQKPVFYTNGAFKHYYFHLTRDFGNQDLPKVSSALSVGGSIIVSIAIPPVAQQNHSGEAALKAIVDGDYDETLVKFCDILAKKDQNIYLRFDPEMEVPVHIFPWQYQSPQSYIDAFRHVSLLCKEKARNIKVVWGAAGYPGAEEYWPGNDVVDLITVTINGQSERESSGYPVSVDVKEAVKRKIHRMRFMDKPIFILGPERSGDGSLLRDDLLTAISEIRRERVTVYGNLIPKDDLNDQGAGKAPVPIIGVYDPRELLVKLPQVTTEHLFTDLGSIQDGRFLSEFNTVVARGHHVIVTLEPWRDHKTRKDSSVLLNTLHGVYDEEFREFYRIISNTRQTVYLRFAHEMEIPIHRYAWQSQDPVLYIKAFRRFMFLKPDGVSNIRRVWGPAGDRGAPEWWPGNDVVDFISIALYGLPDKNITDPEKQESFETIYRRKFHRMRFLDKPIFVTEFGVKGPEVFQQKWLGAAAGFIGGRREVYGTCYFNLADNPKVWGNIPAPDWGISKETFTGFANTLLRR